MTWPVRSKQLAFYNSAPGANVPVGLGTVPSGKVWLLKEWTIYNNIGGARVVHLFIKSGSTTNPIWLATINSGAVGEPSRERDIVLMAGMELQFQTSVAGSIAICCYGAQLG